jgi:hypothetical protein
VIQQLAVELKADTIRLVERASNSGASELPAATADDVPFRGLVSRMSTVPDEPLYTRRRIVSEPIAHEHRSERIDAFLPD